MVQQVVSRYAFGGSLWMLNSVEALREAAVQDDGLAQFLCARLLNYVAVFPREEYLVCVSLRLDSLNQLFDLRDALVDGVLTFELVKGLHKGRIVQKLAL